MLFIRSLVFQIVFYALNTILCLSLVWCLLLPRRWAFAVLYNVYFKSVHWCEKLIIGLDYKVTGTEHIPQQGSYIIAMKHQSVYETLKMFHIFGDTRILLKKQLALIPLWGWYALKVGMISVDRGRGREAVQSILINAKPVVEAGVPILIYPQGTRVSIHDTIKEKPYKYGAIRMYEHFNIPILPVAMNSGKFWPRNSFIVKSGVVEFKILPLIEAGQNEDEVHSKMQDIIESESLKLL